MRGSVKIDLIPQPGMQVKALECPADEMFLGGQAGPGKSWVLLYADIEDAIRYPELRVLFLRRKMPELADLLQKAMEMYLPLGAKFFAKHSLYLRPAFVFPRYTWKEDEDGQLYDIEPIEGETGAVFVFGHMSEERTKFDYGGFEWTRINWDEICNFLESQYLFLWSRMRSAKKIIPERKDPITGKIIPAKEQWIKTKVRATGNPVGVGMLWVKRRFIDVGKPEVVRAFIRLKGREAEVPIGTPRSKTRCFIPGDRQENKFVGEDYEGNLAQLDEKMYRALADGLWEVSDVPGQLISGKWLDHAMSGRVLPLSDPLLMDLPALAFDYATDQGVDKSVLIAGRGNRPNKVRSWPYTRQDDAAWIVATEVEKYGSEICRTAVDGNGPGHGLVERLESGAKEVTLTLPEKKGWVVSIPKVKNLERCVEVDRGYSELMKALKKKKFPNFRSQMYWQLREDFEYGRIDLSGLVQSQDENTTEHLEKLQEELLAITFEERAGLIYIIKKEDLRHADRLGRSPDYADTLAMWNWVRQRTRPKFEDSDIDEFGDKREESLEEKYACAHF